MNDWCLEVWGDYACFTRPEMKVERVSYDVITPSAARAIFEAILWKPPIKWNITKIEVLNPIQWTSVRRNEVGKTVSGPTAKQIKGDSPPPQGIFIEDSRQQKAGLFLRDVRYRIYAYFDFLRTKADNDVRPDESEAKYAAMFERRATKGQCFHRPYLGCREFACYFQLIDAKKNPVKPIDETRDLGFMLYDLDFENPNNPTPIFFRAKLDQGQIITDRREIEVRK